jgi:hypothetical protein
LNADWFRTVVHQVANRGEVIALDTPTHAAHFDIGDRAQRGTCAICKPATANVISERAAAYWCDLAKSADQNRPGTEVVVPQATPRERQAAEQDAIVEGNRVGLAM